MYILNHLMFLKNCMLYSLARLHVPPPKKKHLTILEHSPAQPCQEMDLKTKPKKPMVYHNVPCNCSHLREYTMVCLIWVWVNTYRYILVGWTSIYQLFWGSLGTKVLTHPHFQTRPGKCWNFHWASTSRSAKQRPWACVCAGARRARCHEICATKKTV